MNRSQPLYAHLLTLPIVNFAKSSLDRSMGIGFGEFDLLLRLGEATALARDPE